MTKTGFEPFFSPDGKWLYYIPQDFAAGISRMPAGGGPESLVFRDPDLGAWAVAGKHVYAGLSPANGPCSILRIDPESGRREEIYRFPAGVSRFTFATSLAVSPDEKTIYHAGSKRTEGDIVLVDHFQ